MASRGGCLVIAGFMILLLLGCVSAEYAMTLYVTPPSFSENETAPIEVNLVNSGDDVAYSGSLELMYPPMLSSEPLFYNTVNPNVNYTGHVNVSLKDYMIPGFYPVLFSLQFQDSNGYPIYMLFESRLTVGRQSNSKVYAELSDVEFPDGKSGKLTLKIRNADDVPHTVETRLMIPGSLKSDKSDETLELMPQTEEEIDYRISNFMALPGSNLYAFVAVEYDEDGIHYSTLARGKVVVSEKSDTDLSSFSLLVLVVLAVLGVYSYFKYFK